MTEFCFHVLYQSYKKFMVLMIMSRTSRENAKCLFLNITLRLLMRGKCKSPVLAELLLSPRPASSLCPSSTVGDLLDSTWRKQQQYSFSEDMEGLEGVTRKSGKKKDYKH